MDEKGTSLSIREALRADMSDVGRFYEAAGYRGSVTERAVVLLAHRGGEIVGLVRLEPEQGTLVLRGMQVRDDCQRQGIGTALLAAVAGRLGDTLCYSVPYARLRAFYGRTGFVEVPSDALPPFLSVRAEEYRRRGLDVIVMRRAAGRVES